MRKVNILLSVLVCALSQQAYSADLSNQARLQRGAKIFMNYCSGCHSLRFLRYSQMAKDLGLTTSSGEVDNELVVNNLIFTKATIEDPVLTSLAPEDARDWFGLVPQDLSLIARERGSQWLYSYLQGFYSDKSRPFGSNNQLVHEAAMPDILAPLRKEMNMKQFDSTIVDLVTFLVYVSEPAQLIRYRMGVWVTGFIFIFLIVAYCLKKLVWKNI